MKTEKKNNGPEGKTSANWKCSKVKESLNFPNFSVPWIWSKWFAY